MQKLVNFDVTIEPVGGGYRARVASSPAGEASADFALPFTDKDLTILVLQVMGSVGRDRRKAVRRIESPTERLLENFGGQLFEAVFSGPVRECLERSRLTAESKGAGLRIRLRLPGELANVPWEYLYDTEHGFVSLSPETALVRYLEMPRAVRPFPISPPLRILAMISAPSDVSALQSEEEWDKLSDALSDLTGQGIVQLERLESGKLSALQRPLRLREQHILHFVGHGYWDEDAQDGALALEGADGRTRLVTGRSLGLMLRGHRSLRMVVLNACEGARSAPGDPLGGVAQALVRQGIPAVIAMQFEISDPAAVVFSQSFYQAIADGLPVDVAMVEARRAMWAEGHEVEWATPVLYLRSPDGRVFTKGRGTNTDRKALADADRPAHEIGDLQARDDETTPAEPHRHEGTANGSDSSSLVGLAAVGVRGHHLETWALRADGKISHSWWPRDDGEKLWNESHDFDAPSGTIDIAVSSRGPEHAEVFAVDHYGNLWHRWWLQGKGWSNWRQFTDKMAGPLAACSFSDGHIQVFAVDATSKSVGYFSSSAPGVWDPWTTLNSLRGSQS